MVYFLWNAIPWIQNLEKKINEMPSLSCMKKLSKFFKYFTRQFFSHSIIANQYQDYDFTEKFQTIPEKRKKITR